MRRIELYGKKKVGTTKTMKLTNYLFATGAYLSYVVPLAGAANVPICHGNATQDATAFAIQVHDEL
jgi:hypothetical protein